MTTTIVFDHRGRSSQLDEGPIEVRITHARRLYYIGTGVRVRKNEWRASTMEIVNRQDAVELTERVRIIVRRIEDEVNMYIAEGRAIDVREIKKRVWNLDEVAGTDMYDWMWNEIEYMKLRQGSMKHYRSFFNRLQEYKKLMKWKDLSTESIIRFDRWLHGRTDTKRDGRKEKLSDAAVYNYHKCMKALLRRACVIGKIELNPYDRLRGQFSRGEKENVEYLTDEEMALLVNAELPEGLLSLARDLFVFQMYTGMSYSDMQAFDFSKYHKVGSSWRLTGARVKTGVPFVSQLLPPAVRVLEKYNMKIPKIYNADYNNALKAVAATVGIRKDMHSHLARHTFATWMLRNGVSIEHVSKMLGHTNITQTQRYAKILAESIHADFERMAELIK